MLQEDAGLELEQLRMDCAQQESKIRKLQEGRRRNDDIFRHLRQGVVVLDQNLAVEWSNPAARRLTRRTSVQILGMSFDEIEWHSAEGRRSFDPTRPSPWRRCLQTDSPVDPARLALVMDGRMIWLELFCFPAYDPQGNVDQVVILMEDVTRLVGSGREISRLQDELGSRSEASQNAIAPLSRPNPQTTSVSNGEPKREASLPGAIRVLLVEDNSVNQAVAMGILRKLGLELEMAGDGQQALERLAKSPFHLVFMDCQMPVMDGYEATRRIRDPSTRVMNHSVPIVAVTANALKGDREKCLECGMDDYLPKPVTRDGFEQVLSKWIPGWVAGSISALASDLEEPPSQSPVPVQREIFDRSALVRRLLGQEELVETLLNMFFQDTPPQVKELEQAVAESRWADAQRTAHGLKGTLANLEARSAAQVASVVEHACRAGNAQVAKDATADLKDEIGKAEQAMRSHL
jgi:CheY-like chemotaxis protein